MIENIYDEILYPDQNKLSHVFFHNRASIREVTIGRISRKFQILLNFTLMIILPRYYGALNIFITSELYRDVKAGSVRNLRKGFIRVQDNLLQTFRKKLNDPDLNIYVLSEFECKVVTA